MGCGSSNTSTNSSSGSTTSAPPAQYSQAYSDLLGQAQQTASQPLQQYNGNIVAGFSPDQQAAFSTINNSQGVANPYIAQAGNYLQAATNPLWQNTSQFSQGAVQGYSPAGVQGFSQANLQQYTPPGYQPTSTIDPSSIQFNPQQFSAGALQQYESPYTQNVVNATEQQFNNQNAQQFNQANGSAAAAGAFGGDRNATLLAQLGGQQQAQEAPVIANLENTGFQTALGEFNTQQQTGLAAQEAQANAQLGAQQQQIGQNLSGYGLGLQGYSAGLGELNAQQQLGLQEYGTGLGEFNTQQQQQLSANEANSWLNSQAGFGEANLGQQALSSALAGSSAQLQEGSLEQELQQEQLNVPYEQYVQQQAYPFQTQNWLAGLETGVGSNAGGTSASSGSGTSTTPGANPFSQILGLATTAASFAKDGGRLKNNVIPFHKRDSGGMVPYQEIALSDQVPDESAGFVPSVSITRGNGLPTSSAPTESMQAQPADPLAAGEGALISSNLKGNSGGASGLQKLFGVDPDQVAVTPNQLTDLGGSGGFLGTGESMLGGAIGDIGSGALSSIGGFFSGLKAGGMVPKRRADGGPNGMEPAQDPNDDTVFMTNRNPALTHTALLGDNAGMTPVQPAAIQQQPTDYHNALLAAGLAMMAGGSHNALQNIGAGGLQGLKQWGADKAANTAAAEKQANLQIENNRNTITQEDARASAARALDDMDERRVNDFNNQTDKNRTFSQSVANEKDTRNFQNRELGIRQQEINNSQAGNWSYQGTDPVTGDVSEINSRTGAIRDAGRPLDAKPSATGAGGSGYGGREAIFTNRIINAGNSAATAAANIMELPSATTSGIFGGRQQGPGLMDALQSDLANKVTGEDAQAYNTMFAGVSRNLATLEASGLAPNGSLIGSMDSLQLKEGDLAATKLRKMAELRQIVDTNLAPSLSNSRIPADQRALVKQIISQIDQAVPFTQHDLTVWEKNPNQTLRQFSDDQGLGRVPPPSDRQLGVVYPTPKGPLQWTKNGWVKPANTDSQAKAGNQ